MVQLRSLGANTAVRRAQWRALGLSDADLEKPKIAVVNSSSELAICYAHLDGVAKIVKDAVLKVYPGYPHGMPQTHKDVINADLLAFVQGKELAATSAKSA